MENILKLIFFMNISFSISYLNDGIFDTQNDYFTTYSGQEYLVGTLEIGITADEDLRSIQMSISQYNDMSDMDQD